MPNSLDILPPAPAWKFATQSRDVASAAAARKLKGSARWNVARQDADLSFPNAADDFSCALGVKVSRETTPHVYTLLRRTLTDAGLSTYPTKNQYMRARPFTVTGGPICTPDQADMLRKDGSYPSGHSAIGWTWALILAEVAPDRADAILAPGRAFMESRVVCNVHWLRGAKVGYAFKSYQVAFFVRNLTNEKNLIDVIDTSNYRAGIYNEPRVFGVTLSGSFR